MLSVEQFNELEVGDLVEAGSMLPPATQEATVFHTVEKKENRLEFVVTFLGVTLGRWACVKDGEVLSWLKM